MVPLWHWFLQVSGTNNEAGRWYAFWSGFGADLTEFVLVTGAIGFYRKYNCHAKGCPWIARHDYEIDGITHHLCRKCHPAIDHKQHLRRHHFAEHHANKR